MTSNLQSQFLQNEIWTLTIAGGFQRANVYKKWVSEKERNTFKKELRILLDSLVKDYMFETPTENKHLQNIQAVSDFSKKHSAILTNGKLNFGVSQKLLNLYLKYLWCLGITQEPPHFPVDRIIQEKLKYKPVVAWTQMKDQQDYLYIINHARQIAKTQKLSLPVLELELFNRR